MKERRRGRKRKGEGNEVVVGRECCVDVCRVRGPAVLVVGPKEVL